MNKIDLRVWNKETQSMVYISDLKGLQQCDPSLLEEKLIMGYTGLKDDCGQKIYKDDILLVDEQNMYGGIYECSVDWIEYATEKEQWAFYGTACLNCEGEAVYNDKVNTLYTMGFLTRTFGSCIQLNEMTKEGFGTIKVIGNKFEGKVE